MPHPSDFIQSDFVYRATELRNDAMYTSVDQVVKVKYQSTRIEFSECGPAGVLLLSSVQIARNETFIFLEKLKPALHHLQGGNKPYMREANFNFLKTF